MLRMAVLLKLPVASAVHRNVRPVYQKNMHTRSKRKWTEFIELIKNNIWDFSALDFALHLSGGGLYVLNIQTALCRHVRDFLLFPDGDDTKCYKTEQKKAGWRQNERQIFCRIVNILC